MVSFALSGVGVSGGIAIGRAQLVSHATLEVAHYTIPASKVDGEIARFTNAVKEVQKELEGLHHAITAGDVPGEFGAFLDVHWMILTDPTLSEAPKRIIAEQRCNAEWALTQQLGVLVEQFEQIEDPYLRERKADIVQVGERVLKRLMGKPGSLPSPVAEEQTILVAHDLSPADVIQFKHHHYGAFLTDVGGVTSHTAIVARSLNVPAVVATHNARQLIRDSEMLIVDGNSGVVIINPDRAVLAEYRLKQSRDRARAPEAQAAAHQAGGDDRRRCASSCTRTSSCPRTWRRRSRTARPASASSARSSCSSIAKGCRPRTSSSRRTARSRKGCTGNPVTIRTFDLGADKNVAGAGRPRARRAQSGAGPARRALLPGRAAALPDAAARDPARVALRQACASSIPMLASSSEIDQTLVDDRAGQGDPARAGRAVRFAASRSAA